MTRALLFGIGLFFGGGVGFLLAAGYGITLDGHDHGVHGTVKGPAGQHDHAHGEGLNLPDTPDAPTVSAVLRPDPRSGWNLHVQTRNFAFAPERASTPNMPGEGHAHVYVNGEKVARLYGEWLHIESLPDGNVELRVTLNTNDHSAIAVEGVPVEAVLTLP